jgi:hypothetical protein
VFRIVFLNSRIEQLENRMIFLIVGDENDQPAAIK